MRASIGRALFFPALVLSLVWATDGQQLPVAAQDELDKGIQATKLPDYPLAIRHFEEAQRSAPENPTILFNLGLAESKIAGRELRAIGWLNAFLIASPSSPNAAAVKDKIAELELRSESNLAGYLRTLQGAATQMTGERQSYDLFFVAKYWAESGDISAANAAAGLIQDGYYASLAQAAIATALATRGESDAAARLFAAALTKADTITNQGRKATARAAISDAQKTATAPKSGATPLVIADWVTALQSDPLNSAPILDLAGHLKSLPNSDQPQKVFEPMRQTADKLVRSQTSIARMMKGVVTGSRSDLLESLVAKDASRIAALPIEGLQAGSLLADGPRTFLVRHGRSRLSAKGTLTISADGITFSDKDHPDQVKLDMKCVDISEAVVPGGIFDKVYFRVKSKDATEAFIAESTGDSYNAVETIKRVCGLDQPRPNP